MPGCSPEPLTLPAVLVVRDRRIGLRPVPKSTSVNRISFKRSEHHGKIAESFVEGHRTPQCRERVPSDQLLRIRSSKSR